MSLPLLSNAAAPGAIAARRGQKWIAASQRHHAARLEKAGFAAAIQWSGADQKRVKAATFHLKPFFRVETAGYEIGTTGSEVELKEEWEEMKDNDEQRMVGEEDGLAAATERGESLGFIILFYSRVLG
jgi:hypothetical protein